MSRLGVKALFFIVFSFVFGLGIPTSASETVYPECDFEFGYPDLVGDICSYDKKYDDHFYRVKNDEYEAIWYNDGTIMIWHHVSKFLGEYDPTLFIDADGETEFATEWDKNEDPINPVYKKTFRVFYAQLFSSQAI